MARDDLALAPTALYRAKAALTHLRSWRWRVRRRPAAPGLRILFYHRVSDDRDELAVTPARFAEQMARLAHDGLRAVDVEQAHALLAAEQARGVVGLCFDDGYADVARNAVPVLEQHGFGATVFLPTGVIDGSAAFAWYATQPAMPSPTLRRISRTSPPCTTFDHSSRPSSDRRYRVERSASMSCVTFSMRRASS